MKSLSAPLSTKMTLSMATAAESYESDPDLAVKGDGEWDAEAEYGDYADDVENESLPEIGTNSQKVRAL